MNEATEQASADWREGYDAVRNGGAGLIDFSSHGLIEVTGAEAVMFLNGLITNDVKTLEDDSWMLAAFPNVQGRLLAFARVMRRGDKFLFDTERATKETVLNNLSRFTLAGDFRVTDLSDEINALSIQGAKADDIVRNVFGEGAVNIEGNHIVSINDGFVIKSKNGFDVFVDAKNFGEVKDSLLNAGAKFVSEEAFEILRIEDGIPRYGVDMNETTVVLETGIDEAVSFKKGCYVGQEIIARIHFRGHVAKKLTGIGFEETVSIKPEDKIKTPDGAKEIGRITSATFSPKLNKTIALGYVRYEHLADGTDVLVVSEEKELKACVVDLPHIVKGSVS
jgi:folate-binding protein YgfZ